MGDTAQATLKLFRKEWGHRKWKMFNIATFWGAEVLFGKCCINAVISMK